MRLNTAIKTPQTFTHEGAPAARITPEQQLRRVVMANMLWEKQFYVDGQEPAKLIAETLPHVKPEIVAQIAIDAREKMKLRHVPLLLVREMARLASHKHLVAKTLERVIQRPDELGEMLAIYWRDGKCPVSAQVKKGLATAFNKFSEYQLAKYDRDGAVKLRDALFIAHARPVPGVKGYTRTKRKEGAPRPDDAGSQLFGKLVDGTLATPDTWEVSLSATKGEGKKEAWERLIQEKRLGALATIRNLKNFQEAGLSDALIRQAIVAVKTERVLPFRFIAAARYAPKFEPELEQKMFECVKSVERLPGKTVLLVDVSGSMEAKLSEKSDMTGMDAACGLAILAREIAEEVEIYSFSNDLRPIPLRRGFALRDALTHSQPHGGTELGKAVAAITGTYQRLVVFTDEQSHDPVGRPAYQGYMINVAAHQHGVGYGPWVHLDGFSEAVLDWVRESESTNADQ